MIPKRITIVGVDTPAFEKSCPHWLGIHAGLRRIGIPYQFVSCRPELDIQAILDFQPDLVVYCIKDMVLRPKWRRLLRNGLPNAKIVMWYGDLRNEKTGQIDADCSELDAMFVSNDAQEAFYKWKWRVKEVHYLPLGCEPIAKPIIEEKFKLPFVFIGAQITGSVFHERASIIETYKTKGGVTLINSFEPAMRKKIYEAMPAIYSSSKIALDISHFTEIQGYTSIRFFEIPAMYGFALTKRFPGCEDLYPIGTRAYFDTFDEAMEMKEYYLNHEKERQEIVDEGHTWSFNHTYDKRFNKLFSLL